MNLRLGYQPGINSNDTVYVSTSLGEVIAQQIIDTSSFAPVVRKGQLSMNVATSFTNTFSAYQLSFVSTNVVFDKNIVFTLPSNLIIYGLCSFSSNLTISIISTCSKISANSVVIGFDIDENLMVPQSINSTINIFNVSTPSSLAPLIYTFSTAFCGMMNQQFTAKYSMEFPYPIHITYSKTNFTIN
jgi:hypothetical protein